MTTCASKHSGVGPTQSTDSIRCHSYDSNTRQFETLGPSYYTNQPSERDFIAGDNSERYTIFMQGSYEIMRYYQLEIHLELKLHTC